MNKIREKQFGLLKEINRVCRDQNIPVYLYGNTALQAYRNGEFNDYPRMCIFKNDISKFVEGLQNSDFAKTEIIKNDKGEIKSLSVYDPNTIDFYLHEFRKNDIQCLHVTIDFLRVEQSGKKRSLLGSIKKKHKESITIGKNTIPGELFAKSQYIDIMGEPFAVPGSAEQYFDAIFRGDWRKKDIAEYSESNSKFRDGEHSWEEFKKRISHLDFSRYFEDYEDYKITDQEVEDTQQIINGYYRYLYLICDRFDMYYLYKDKKDELLACFEKGQTETLEEQLKPYFEAIERNEKNDLGLCFDKDIFEIAMKMYDLKGMHDYGDRVRSIVPESHMQPVQIYDYKGAVVSG